MYQLLGVDPRERRAADLSQRPRWHIELWRVARDQIASRKSRRLCRLANWPKPEGLTQLRVASGCMYAANAARADGRKFVLGVEFMSLEATSDQLPEDCAYDWATAWISCVSRMTSCGKTIRHQT